MLRDARICHGQYIRRPALSARLCRHSAVTHLPCLSGLSAHLTSHSLRRSGLHSCESANLICHDLTLCEYTLRIAVRIRDGAFTLSLHPLALSSTVWKVQHIRNGAGRKTNSKKRTMAARKKQEVRRGFLEECLLIAVILRAKGTS